jgi:hypothetical protein
VRTAQRDGTLEITVEDDGGGIDFEAIRRVAVANALIGPAQVSDEAALLELVYAPGFSTRASVTEVSGRGVGMDAVKSAISKVGGLWLAVSARWTPTVEPEPNADAIDPMQAIELLATSRQTSIDPSIAGRALSLRLRWGFLEASLRAATEPRVVTAERICPTADDHALEVVTIDGQETLLLRPEHLIELAVARGRAAGRGS